MFYKSVLPGLESCDSTSQFCLWINNLFDALNRNPHSGTSQFHHIDSNDSNSVRERRNIQKSTIGVALCDKNFQVRFH